jgi:hypothetical protein
MDYVFLIAFAILMVAFLFVVYTSKGIHININYNMPASPDPQSFEDVLYDKDGKPLQSDTEKALNDLTMKVQNIMLGKEPIDE